MVKLNLFLDFDGVLVDFDKKFFEITGEQPRYFEDTYGRKEFWKVIKSHGNFFGSLDKMLDADILVDAVRRYNPTILTGCPMGNADYITQKKESAARLFPGIPIQVCESKDKRNYQKGGHLNVIIDDWDKYKNRWEETGGVFILHTSALESIRLLNELLISENYNQWMKDWLDITAELRHLAPSTFDAYNAGFWAGFGEGVKRGA